MVDIMSKTLNQKLNEILRKDKIAKTYKGEWYSVNSLFGNDWAMFYVLCGGRECGKSYSAMRWGVLNKIRKGDKFKFYWFRLTDTQCQKLLTNGADKLVDPDLKRKYNIKTTTKGSTVYTYDEVITTKRDGTEVHHKTNLKEFCNVLSCSTFYATKGVGFFDNEFDGEYYIVLDEMNRESSEKNTFDIVYNFVNLLENVVRSTKTKIKVVMIGNTLTEASDILSAFNFLPEDFGRYKLKSKRCVVDYIRPSEEYKKRRKGTIADILLPDASTFTNEIEIDRTLLVNKNRREYPDYIIKFTQETSGWFTVWNNSIVEPWNGEQKPAIAMRKYLNEVFTVDGFNSVFERFNARAFKYTNIATFKKFQRQLKLLKK